MTAMQTDGLTHKIADSASIASPDKLEELAHRVWQEVIRCSTEKSMHNGMDGVKYRGALPIARVGGELRNGLSQDQRETLDNAVRQFLRYSKNAICTNRQRGQVEWWAARTWVPATMVTSVRKDTRPERQENWYEKKVTEQEITGGYGPFPVETRRAKIDPDKKFELDPRWRAELERWLSASGDETATLRLTTMAATWTEPFTTQDYASLFNGNIMVPAAAIATLYDAGLLSGETPEQALERGMQTMHTHWSTTPGQRLTISELLDQRVPGSISRVPSSDTRHAILEFLSHDKASSTPEIARGAFISRSRLNMMLRTMSSEGVIVRVTEGGGGGNHATWRRATPKAKPAPQIPATPTPAVVPPKNPAVARPDPFTIETTSSANDPSAKDSSPSETDDIARSIDRIVQKRVRAALDDLTSSKDKEIAELQQKLKLTQETLAEAKLDLHELREWKKKAQELFNT